MSNFSVVFEIGLAIRLYLPHTFYEWKSLWILLFSHKGKSAQISTSKFQSKSARIIKKSKKSMYIKKSQKLRICLSEMYGLYKKKKQFRERFIKKKEKTNKNQFCSYTYLRPVKINFFPFFPRCVARRIKKFANTFALSRGQDTTSYGPKALLWKILVYSKYVGKKRRKKTNFSKFSATCTYLKLIILFLAPTGALIVIVCY